MKTTDAARGIATGIWAEAFGAHAAARTPHRVDYDAESAAWLVAVPLPKNAHGGGLRLLVRAGDGDVLAAWGEK